MNWKRRLNDRERRVVEGDDQDDSSQRGRRRRYKTVRMEAAKKL
jgi:hypothetical protein